MENKEPKLLTEGKISREKKEKETTIKVLNDGFIRLVDHMGDDSSICQAARVSYGKGTKKKSDDRALIRYLIRNKHTSPLEMVEFKFHVRVPMDCWRQWIRHRTANVNEYSTRYSEAIDSQQKTDQDKWRTQSKDNKQGSGAYLTTWEQTGITAPHSYDTPGEFLSEAEEDFHVAAKYLYDERIQMGVAKEQARKDLPLSTYTEAYWKCDLHNIFNFLRLRMDHHAQLEIRQYANAMFELIKPVCPVACEAFEDYILNAETFSSAEMYYIRGICEHVSDSPESFKTVLSAMESHLSKTELLEFKRKLGIIAAP